MNSEYVLNPYTSRPVKVGTRTYESLVKKGVIKNPKEKTTRKYTKKNIKEKPKMIKTKSTIKNNNEYEELDDNDDDKTYITKAEYKNLLNLLKNKNQETEIDDTDEIEEIESDYDY